MATIWLFNKSSSAKCKPAINSQLISTSVTTLCLRNPWVSDSVFMAKLYCGLSIFLGFSIGGILINKRVWEFPFSDFLLVFIIVISAFTFTPFLLYRIWFIKNLSSFYFNRSTKKIYYKRLKKLIIFDWNNLHGGLFERTESGGASFATMYALAFAPRRADGSLHQKDCLWVDSNEPTEASVQHVAEVWEYLRQFMDHGAAKLPPPGAPNWWHKPLHAICLSPAEAWRHYVPWRTGEPGELQGKKNWQLPFWAVLFPYNITVALCWCAVCWLFRVRAAPPPPEAFEHAPVKPRPKKRR